MAVGFPKPKPAKRSHPDAALDLRESVKVRKRSGGQCEVIEAAYGRCARRAVHVHHELSGIGTRGRGDSALASNKLHVCLEHHSDIHGYVLVRDGSVWRRR